MLDVMKGFWHVELDAKSSVLTMFNTPFGRYYWKRIPFGICSAPEVFQRRIHQLIEDLNGLEVVADNFLFVAFGDTIEATVIDRDQNLEVLLQRK